MNELSWLNLHLSTVATGADRGKKCPPVDWPNTLSCIGWVQDTRSVICIYCAALRFSFYKVKVISVIFYKGLSLFYLVFHALFGWKQQGEEWRGKSNFICYKIYSLIFSAAPSLHANSGMVEGGQVEEDLYPIRNLSFALFTCFQTDKEFKTSTCMKTSNSPIETLFLTKTEHSCGLGEWSKFIKNSHTVNHPVLLQVSTCRLTPGWRSAVWNQSAQFEKRDCLVTQKTLDIPH